MSIAPDSLPVLQLLRGSYASKRDVIQAIGDAMLAAGAVTPAYVEGMLRKEEQGSTMVMPEVALPHGTNDVRAEVRRNAVVVVPVPLGVEWAPGTRVRLAIGFAGTGAQGHLQLMGAIARALSNAQLLSRLKTATSEQDVAAVLGVGGNQRGSTDPSGVRGEDVES